MFHSGGCVTWQLDERQLSGPTESPLYVLDEAQSGLYPGCDDVGWTAIVALRLP